MTVMILIFENIIFPRTSKILKTFNNNDTQRKKEIAKVAK